jgi:hypothetical protein
MCAVRENDRRTRQENGLNMFSIFSHYSSGELAEIDNLNQKRKFSISWDK